MRLRTKILSGFMILAAMLFLAGVWSIYELTTIGTSVEKLLDDNYKSISAGRVMIEALEREDSAVLLLLSGNWEEGRQILNSGDTSFREAFAIARANITIEGEAAVINDISSRYETYRHLWKGPIVATARKNNMTWYFQEAHRAFREVKAEVEKLMVINDQAMYDTASILKERAHRAVMPGIIAIVSALVFALIFNYFISHFIVSPIVNITNGVHDFLKNEKPFKVTIDTKDELNQLVSSIQQLLARARAVDIDK